MYGVDIVGEDKFPLQIDVGNATRHGQQGRVAVLSARKRSIASGGLGSLGPLSKSLCLGCRWRTGEDRIFLKPHTNERDSGSFGRCR
jgi:hypothetical protein